MSKIDAKTLEEYQDLLEKDPNSKIFAALAEGYRELGMLEQAESVVRRGVSRHPQYGAGYLVWARVLMDLKNLDGALKLLLRAKDLSPDNLLVHQLIGQIQLELKNPKEALQAHKMALFLHPESEKSRQIVRKLESLTADEFDEDVFEMKQLNSTDLAKQRPLDLERSLSLIDALIVRNDVAKAQILLKEALLDYPGDAQLQQRLTLVGEVEEPENIEPIASREKYIVQKKIETLKRVLQSIDKNRHLEG